MRSFLLVIALALAAPLAAHATAVKDLSDEDLAPYKWQRDKENAAQAGERFMKDLWARSPEVAANVEDAVRYKIQDQETKKFFRHRRAVIVAYAVLWVVVAGFALSLWLRQRKLVEELRDLEAKLGAEERAA